MSLAATSRGTHVTSLDWLRGQAPAPASPVRRMKVIQVPAREYGRHSHGVVVGRGHDTPFAVEGSNQPLEHLCVDERLVGKRHGVWRPGTWRTARRMNIS